MKRRNETLARPGTGSEPAGTRDDRGVALVIVLLMLVGLTIGGVALMVASNTDTKSQASTVHQVTCMNIAEEGQVAGQARIVDDLQAVWASGGTYTTSLVTLTDAGSTGTTPIPYTNVVTAQGETTVGGLFDQAVILRSTCTSGATRVTVESTGSPAAGSVHGTGVCGCSDVTINGTNFATDSYDSSAGSYGSQTPGSNGNLGSNGDMDLGNGTIGGNCQATDDIESGPHGNCTGGSSAGGTNDEPGDANVTPAPTPCNCTELDVDTLVSDAASSNDNGSAGTCGSYLVSNAFSITGGPGTTCEFPSGVYYMTSFSVGGQATVSFGGPVEMYWGGSGPFSIAGGGLINDPADAADLEIYSNSTGTISVSGGGSWSAFIYAPNADYSNTGGGEMYGAVTADTITMGGSAGFHYDVSGGDREDFVAEWSPTIWKIDRN